MKFNRALICLNRLVNENLPRFSLNTLSTRNTSTNQKPIVLEPAYIDELRPQVGFYQLLNLSIKGHDYVVLEKYQSYLHKTMKKMEFKITDTWSTPQQDLQYESLQKDSSAVTSSDKIIVYERNIQMKDALVTKLPILIDLVNMTMPPGVWFNIDRHTEDHANRRYFRNSELERLRVDLQTLKGSSLIGD